MATIYTIGHSNVPIRVFLDQLLRNDIEVLADVRSYPTSKRCPWFDAVALARELEREGIRYEHILDLGGRRPRQKQIEPWRNAGWENPSFRNYADYTLTEPYETGLGRLFGLARLKRVAYCCSEAVPWRCHRLLISNTLAARGHEVRHIRGGQTELHVLGKYGARPEFDRHRVFYPADQQSLGLAGI